MSDTVDKEEIERLIEKYKMEESHNLTSERQKVVYGSVIADLERLIEDE